MPDRSSVRIAAYFPAWILLLGLLIGVNAGVQADSPADTHLTEKVDINDAAVDVADEPPAYYEYLPWDYNPNEGLITAIVVPAVTAVVTLAEWVAVGTHQYLGWVPDQVIIYTTQAIGFGATLGVVIREGLYLKRLATEVRA